MCISFNPLSPVNAAHVHMVVGSSIRARAICYYLKKSDFLSVAAINCQQLPSGEPCCSLSAGSC